mmetsp:Transcript_27946/g.57350  ORF Transcript_27946/g.57350 Transcript_27946/m.57350 type:complete len:96 (+) Transcript_27946:3-290(+)
MSLDEVTISIMSFFHALKVVSAEPIATIDQAQAEVIAKAIFESDELAHGRCTKKAFACWTSDKVTEAHDEAGAGSTQDLHVHHLTEAFASFEPSS